MEDKRVAKAGNDEMVTQQPRRRRQDRQTCIPVLKGLNKVPASTPILTRLLEKIRLYRRLATMKHHSFDVIMLTQEVAKFQKASTTVRVVPQ